MALQPKPFTKIEETPNYERRDNNPNGLTAVRCCCEGALLGWAFDGCGLPTKETTEGKIAFVGEGLDKKDYDAIGIFLPSSAEIQNDALSLNRKGGKKTWRK